MSVEVDALLRLAASARASGDRKKAVTIYRQLLAEHPLHAMALNGLANILLEDGAIAEARSMFEQAAAADPGAPELWNNLAKAERMLGRDDGERRALDAAIRCDQQNFMARLRSAELCERLGERAAAASHWAIVLSLANSQVERSPALEAVADHARRFLGARIIDFERAIAPNLALARADASSSALRRFDVCVDRMLGKRRIYHNECHGLHYPFLPADEFFAREHFTWMAELESHVDDIRGELLALLATGSPDIAPYVRQAPGTPTNKWSALDGSPDWSAFFLWQFGRRNDDACARCPATVRAMEAVPQSQIAGRSPSVFFSILKPRTRIPPHTGVTNTRSIVHLPLLVPPGCGFRVGGETRKWEEGRAFVFDDTIEHEAWNDSDALRAVLIFDVWNPYLTGDEQRLLGTLFESSDASGFGTDLLN